MDGVLNINKPAGMTSHDVVDKLRRVLHERKVGHTGTLDPDATGVLPVCLGNATKIIQFLQDDEKCYEGTITLGIVTDTLDASGQVLHVSDSSHISLEDIKRVFSRFVGEIDQIPPMVSAIKVQGKRLYSLARQGKTVSRTPRKIRIYELELIDFYKERELVTKIDFRVRCSKGTYIRTLVSDIGEALGCGAHLSRLIRTKSGIFELKDSVKLEEIQAEPQNASQSTKPIDAVLSFMPRIIVSNTAQSRFLNGVPLRKAEVLRFEGELHVDDLMLVYNGAGALLGVGKATDAYGSSDMDPQAIICKVIRVLK